MHTQNTRTNIQAKKYKIYVKNNFSSGSKEQIKLHVYTWITVIELKNLIQKMTKIPRDIMRLFYKTIELTEKNAQIDSYGIKNGITLSMYETKDYRESKGDLRPYDIFNKKNISEKQKYDMKKLESAYEGVYSGFFYQIKPQLTDDGTSGTYFLLDKDKKKTAIFKPMDEEAYAPNNPRGYVGQLGQMGFRKGILSGESANREVAAYILDYYTSGGLHNVPITTYIEFYHPSFDKNQDYSNITKDQLNMKNIQISPSTSTTKSSLDNGPQKIQQNVFTKHGSLQLFKYHEGVVGDFGESLFPVEDVHNIGILDIRILNCDRNEENILIQKVKKYRDKPTVLENLIPIDHGLSLPSNFEIMDYEIVWMYWSAAKKPFSQKNLDFIQSIDIDMQVELLRKKLKIREICLRNFKIANIILKKYAAKGYTLFQIGQILYREDEEEKSPVEQVVEWAETMYKIKKKIGFNAKINKLIKNSHNSKNQSQTLQLLKKMSSQDLSSENSISPLKKSNNIDFQFDRPEFDDPGIPEKIIESDEEDEEDSYERRSKQNKRSLLLTNQISQQSFTEDLDDINKSFQNQNNQQQNNNQHSLVLNHHYQSDKTNGEIDINSPKQSKKSSQINFDKSQNLLSDQKNSKKKIEDEDRELQNLPKLKKIKKSASLPNLDMNDLKSKSNSSEDEEEKQSNQLTLKNQASENNGKFTQLKGTKSSGLNRLNCGLLNEDPEAEIWDEVFFECIENALDIVIGVKNQDPPRTPHLGPLLNMYKQSSNQRSRFMSHDINLEDEL